MQCLNVPMYRDPGALRSKRRQYVSGGGATNIACSSHLLDRNFTGPNNQHLVGFYSALPTHGEARLRRHFSSELRRAAPEPHFFIGLCRCRIFSRRATRRWWRRASTGVSTVCMSGEGGRCRCGVACVGSPVHSVWTLDAGISITGRDAGKFGRNGDSSDKMQAVVPVIQQFDLTEARDRTGRICWRRGPVRGQSLSAGFIYY